MVCPFAKVHVKVQFEMPTVPVLLMVIAAPKPPAHWLAIV